jgi:hypothetical protein
MATITKGETVMANSTNGNQFRDDEIIILDQLRDGKSVKNIFPKIGGRLRLAYEQNDQLSMTAEIKCRSQAGACSYKGFQGMS